MNAALTLREARVFGLKFQAADLTEVKLSAACLCDFTGVVLCDADLSNCRLVSSVFHDADVRAAALYGDLRRLGWTTSTFISAGFDDLGNLVR